MWRFITLAGIVGTAHAGWGGWEEAPTLEVGGICPGVVVLDIEGLYPGSWVALITGVADGSSSMGAGPCADLATGFSEPRLLRTFFDGDLDGELHLTPFLGSGACDARLQAVSLSTCDASEVVPLGDGPTLPDCLLDDWLVGIPCNGVDLGDGCIPEETGYHYKGVYESAGQAYACWWHTKNQAWNTDTTTNFYSLAESFGLTPGSGGSQWCYDLASDPCSAGACTIGSSYHDAGDVGAWGWCGGAPFSSGGHVCIPIEDELADSCLD
jgi:hypothetical protein